MGRVKSSFIDKVLARLDNLSSRQVEVVVDRLAREKGLLEQVLEALQEGVILFDSTGMTMFINQAAETMFGLRDQACIGKSLDELLPGLDWSSFSPDEGSVVSQDLEVLYPERRILNVYSAPIRDEVSLDLGEVSGRVLLLRDITSQQEETEQSLESERFNALTLLAAGVAHEIGNPLNSLGIQLQLLNRKLNKLEESERDSIKPHVDKAQKEIGRLDSILKDFLSAIRPTEPKREGAQLHELLNATVESMSEELLARKTKVCLQLSEGMPELSLDKGQIHQALYNVLRNASQSMSAAEGGQITVRTKVTDFEVSLHVQDEGGGISPEEMGRIYEPFQSSKKEEGTGLGLLIVRRIIREHGGEMKIESELGDGTTVSFYFPRHDQRMKLLGQQEPTETIVELETEAG